MANSENITPFQAVCQSFDRICDQLGVADDIRDLIRTPDKELRVEVPVRMDDGSLEVFIGYRIQHNGTRGPYKGGIRYHPEAHEEEVRALAALMQCSRGHPFWWGQRRGAMRSFGNERPRETDHDTGIHPFDKPHDRRQP